MRLGYMLASLGLLGLGLLIGTHRAGAADAVTGSITGKVVNEDQAAVAGATVRLWSPPLKTAPQRVVATGKTNDKGEFTLKEIPPADGYIIAAETEERWGSKDKLTVKAGKTSEMGVLKIVKGARM